MLDGKLIVVNQISNVEAPRVHIGGLNLTGWPVRCGADGPLVVNEDSHTSLDGPDYQWTPLSNVYALTDLHTHIQSHQF